MFDVIVPIIDNDSQQIFETLDSIQSQSCVDWQAYIISTKPFPSEIKQKYQPNFNWIIGDTNNLPELLNQGVSLGMSDYLTFALPGQFWYDHHLGTLKGSLNANPPFAYTCFEGGKDYEINYVGARYLDAQHLQLGTAELFYRDAPIPITNLVIPRLNFEKVGGFENPLRLNRDIHVRLCRATTQLPVFIDEITTYCLEQKLPTHLNQFQEMTYISDWTRDNPTLINRKKPSDLTPSYWNWLLRLSGAGELKGRERVDCCGGVENLRSIEEYTYFYKSPLPTDNPDWQHLMTTEDEEWAFLDDL
jgi:hypothetical protein